MSYTLTEKEIAHFASQLPEDTKVITIEELNKPGGYDVWDFVQKFHPDYDRSDDIALSDDLGMIIDGSYENSDCAIQLYKEIEEEIQYTNGFLTKSAVVEIAERRQAVVNACIFQDTIENFIKIMKGK